MMNQELKQVIDNMTFDTSKKHPLLTNAVNIEVQPEIDDAFDFYEIIDNTTYKGETYYNTEFFKKIARPIQSHIDVRSCVFLKRNPQTRNVNTRIAIMTDKGLYDTIKALEKDINEEAGNKIVTIQRVSYEEILYICGELKFYQLLLNGITYYKGKKIVRTNDGWSLLEYNSSKTITRKDPNTQEEKEIKALLFNDFTIQTDEKFGTLLVNSVKTFTSFDKDYYDKEKLSYPTLYELKGAQIKVYKDKSKKLPKDLYVNRGLGNSKQIMTFLSLAVSESRYRKTKSGKTGEIIALFNETYNGFAHIKLNPINSVNYLESHISTTNFNKLSEELLQTELPVIYIDYDDSFEKCATTAETIKNTILLLNDAGFKEENVIIQKGISLTEKDIPIVRVVASKEDYKDSFDAYNEVSKEQLNVQHIIADGNEVSKAAVRNTLISLAIQMGVKNKRVNTFGDVERFDGFTFFVPLYKTIEDESEEENNRKKRAKRELKRIDCIKFKDGNFEIININEGDLLDFDNAEYNNLYNAILKTEIDCDDSDKDEYYRFSWGMILPNGDCHIVTSTRINTNIDIAAFEKKLVKLKEVGQSKNNGEGGGLRSEENRKKLFNSLIDSGYTKIDDNYYYYSHYRAKGVAQNITRAPNLHKIEGVKFDDSIMEKLLISMSMPYNKNGELSVAPYPVKILRTLQ